MDGCVDFREFATAAFSLFDQLDRNNDGKITPKEFNPQARPGARGAGRGGGEQGGGQGGGRGGRGGGPPGGGS